MSLLVQCIHRHIGSTMMESRTWSEILLFNSQDKCARKALIHVSQLFSIPQLLSASWLVFHKEYIHFFPAFKHSIKLPYKSQWILKQSSSVYCYSPKFNYNPSRPQGKVTSGNTVLSKNEKWSHSASVSLLLMPFLGKAGTNNLQSWCCFCLQCLLRFAANCS